MDVPNVPPTVFINCQAAFRLSEFLKVASTGYQSGHMHPGLFLFALILVMSDSRKTMFKHAYPVTAQFAISLRGPRLRGRTGLCTISHRSVTFSHRSVTLSGRQFSVHYQKPLMARNDD